MQLPQLLTRLGSVLLGALASAALHAAPVPLNDDELGSVSGRGIGIAVHLQLNADRVTAGFNVDGVKTYLVLKSFGGGLDLFSVGLEPTVRADGSAYLALLLPTYLAASNFGVGAIGAQQDAAAPVTSSYGSLLLNGSATLTGQLMLWPRQ